jgi:hypothetical protein
VLSSIYASYPAAFGILTSCMAIAVASAANSAIVSSCVLVGNGFDIYISIEVGYFSVFWSVLVFGFHEMYP